MLGNLPYRSPVLTTYTLTLTANAQALTDKKCAAVLIQADPDNTGHIRWGNSAAQHMYLAKGTSFSIQVENASMIYAKRDTANSPILVYTILE